jgi:hypothetical protein
MVSSKNRNYHRDYGCNLVEITFKAIGIGARHTPPKHTRFSRVLDQGSPRATHLFTTSPPRPPAKSGGAGLEHPAMTITSPTGFRGRAAHQARERARWLRPLHRPRSPDSALTTAARMRATLPPK